MNPPSAHQPVERNDQDLDELLRTAQVAVPLPNAFQSDVWKCIAVRHQSTLPAIIGSWMERMFESLVGPVPAAATLLFMISGGIWLGSKESEPVKNGKSAYVQSVSPFAAHHQGGVQ